MMLQKQARAAGDELAVFENSNPVTENICFIQEMRRQDYASTFLCILNHIPNHSSIVRIHPTGI